MTIDIERIAREAGEIAFADGKYTLQKGDVIMSPDALAAYTAQVLEEAAKVCEAISDEYQRSEGRRFPELKSDAQTGASDCEDRLRTIAASLGGKDGG